MEVMAAVKSGTLLHALRVQLKRRVSALRGGDYNEVPQAIQKKSRPSTSTYPEGPDLEVFRFWHASTTHP
jgi:hypothetical protein